MFWHCESDETDKLLGCNGKEHEGMMCGNWNYEISTEKWGDQTTSINEAVFTEWQVTIDDVHWLRWTYIDFDLNKKFCSWRVVYMQWHTLTLAVKFCFLKLIGHTFLDDNLIESFRILKDYLKS